MGVIIVIRARKGGMCGGGIELGKDSSPLKHLQPKTKTYIYLIVMAILGCQLDYIWHYLKPKRLGTRGKVFFP